MNEGRKKAQIMFEFLLVIVLVATLFLLLSAFLLKGIMEKERGITNEELDLLGKNLQEKMFTVSNMRDGLHLEVELPKYINKKDYDIYILNNHLYLEQGSFEKIYLLPEVSGNITNRSFTLVNENQEVIII